MRIIILSLLLSIAPHCFLSAQFSILGQQPTCNGYCNGSATVSTLLTTTHHYLWSTGDTTKTVSNLCAGNYQCIVSDSLYQPLDTLQITIQQPPALVISPAVIKNEPCYGDSTGYIILH